MPLPQINATRAPCGAVTLSCAATGRELRLYRSYFTFIPTRSTRCVTIDRQRYRLHWQSNK